MSAAQKALVNPSAVLRNRKILDRVHTIMAILVGLAAGITGLTGLKGFAAFALSHLVVGGARPPPSALRVYAVPSHF